ncbi:MAG: membrane dipeptidase [Bacteroidetes bacterium]|nr:MAG: membrane dipeptidase [Bacteroidota bacterium]
MRVLTGLALLAVLMAGCDRGEEALLEQARAIHERVLTLDTHADIPFNFATDEVDPLDADRQVNLLKMEEGGLDAAFFIVYVGQTARTPENYEKAKADAMIKFDAIHRMAEEMYPDRIALAYTADDVERIHREGKLVAAIGIENGYVIGKDLSLLKKYYDLGARYITLAHNGHNDIADSAQPQPDLGDAEAEHGGLSPFGEEVVREMNRLGIMVDVSHISKAAMLDAVRVSRAPVIASHSSVRALADHPRNMDDEQLRALKENGGVIHIVALDAYVKADPPEKVAAVEALREEMGITGFAAWQALSDSARAVYRARMDEIEARWPGPDVSDFVDHIDYAVNLIGIDHVGISSDFDGGGGIRGWQDASETFNVTRELVRRGYTEAQIAQLWSGNLLRVWREVERVARAMQAEGEAD